LRTLRNKKKDARDEETKQFVTRFLKEIDDKREEIAKKIEEERPKIEEMSTLDGLDALRKLTI